MMCQRIGISPTSTIGLGLNRGFLGEPGAESTCKDNDFHTFAPKTFDLK